MPLDRAHVTIASRVMLRVYPVFAFIVGLSLLLTPQVRLLATPSLMKANTWLPLHLWGAGFVAVAATQVLALVVSKRRMYKIALYVMAAWLIFWTLMNLDAAFDGQASFSAWAWPAFVAVACYATLLSLEARER